MSCDPWPLAWPCGEPPADSTEEQQTIAVAVAQDMLWGLTGRRLGTCTVTEAYQPHRPRRHFVRPDAQVIHLRQRPVERVLAVEVDGVLLDPSAYRLGVGGRLYRIDGQLWPWAALEGDTPVVVQYVWGVRLTPFAEEDPLPPYAYSAGIAVGEIAVELVSGMCGNACKLPSRLASLSRQGVSLEFLPPGDFIEAGLTGLPLADAFIRAVNPNRLRMRSAVFSPDMARRV